MATTELSFAAGFKLKAISSAEESKNCAASHQFRVYEIFICDWRKNKAKLEIIPKSKKTLQHGKLPYPELKNVLHGWVVKCQQNRFTDIF